MCKHEQFIKSLGEPQSNREYWMMTEIFVYLHNGKDYCDCQKNSAQQPLSDLQCSHDWIYLTDGLSPVCKLCGKKAGELL